MFRAIVFYCPDYGGNRRRKIGRVGQCSCKFFGYDPATTRNAPKRSIADAITKTSLRPLLGLTEYFPFRARTPQRADSACDQIAIDGLNSTSQVEHRMLSAA